MAAIAGESTPGPERIAPEGTSSTFTIDEDVPRTLSAADFGYSDGDGEAFAGVTIVGAPSKGSLFVNGSFVTAGQFVSAVQLAAGELVFVPAADANGIAYANFGFKVRDAAGFDDESANTITIDVTPINDAPRESGFHNNPNRVFFEGAGPVELDNGGNAQITDPDSTDFAGGFLRVAITAAEVAAEDLVSIAAVDGVTVSGTAGGSTVSVDGVAIGTIAVGGTGRNGEDLLVLFNAAATPAAVSKLIHALTYWNNNDLNPLAARRSFDVTLSDGDGPQLATYRVNVDVIGENDAPTLGDPSQYRLIHVEGAPQTSIFAGVTVSDPDSPASWDRASFTLIGGKFALTGNRFVAIDIGEPFQAIIDTTTQQRIARLTTGSSEALVQFEAASTQESVNALLPSFGFQPVNLYGQIARSVVSMEFVDGGLNGGDSLRDFAVSQEIIVLPNAPAPIVDLNGTIFGLSTQVSFTENGPATALGPDIWVLDTNLGNTIDKMTVVLHGRAAADVFTHGALPAGVSVVTTDLDAFTTRMTFTGVATPEAYRDLLAGIRFSNTAEAPVEGSSDGRWFDVSVESDGVSSGVVQVDLRLYDVDDPAQARDDLFSVGKTSILLGDVLADNGSGADSDIDTPLYVAKLNGAPTVPDMVTLPSGARLQLYGGGSFRYDPNGAFAGPATDSFTYSLQGGETATVTVQITDGSGINGTNGPDTLHGTNGGEVIDGLGGNDLLFSGAGIDTLLGGTGDDGLYFGAHMDAEDHAHGGAGIDTLAIQGNYPILYLPDVTGIEVLLIASGADARFGDTAGNVYNYSVISLDKHVAAGGTLTVIANDLRPGEELYFNGAQETDGVFRIFGGQGRDQLVGGQGSDGFFFGADGNFAATDQIHGQGGIDSIALRGNYVGARAIVTQDSTFAGIEVLTFLSGHTNEFGGPISATGFDYNVTLANGNVAQGQRLDIIATTLRADESLSINAQWVNQGSVRILSGAGDDTIVGSNRIDILYGGLGADSIDGNTSGDTFLYRAVAESTAAARDTLTFGTGDKIDLAVIDAVVGTAANDAFTFIGNAAFSNVAGELRAVQVGAQFTVEADVNGDGVADMVIGGTSAAALIATDFIL